MKKVGVIGSGFASLSAASYLAKAGFSVEIFEKNIRPGGRARQFQTNGFSFDMGPSWYWMPDVFEQFFSDFGHSTKDFYQLDLLDPGFRVFFPEEILDIPASKSELTDLFESIEQGAGDKLINFLADGAYKYKVGMQDLVYKSGLRYSELLDFRILRALFKLHMATPFDKFVASHFSHPYLKRIMEFPVLFLGAAPDKTPALYSLMNYAGLELGTWYPKGGMVQIVNGMVELAKKLGVQMRLDEPVIALPSSGNKVGRVTTNKKDDAVDIVVAGADYHHVDSKLLDAEYRNYTETYWEKRTMAPSSLLYYIGVDKKIDGLIHHNLFFDEDLQQHAVEIYENPQWPSAPLFYVCCPSKTDESVAPQGHENIFILIPVAPGLENDLEHRERYFNLVMDRLEKRTKQAIREHIVFRRDFSHHDFKTDYNAFKGNAYGLANTLRQTANLKPKIRNRQLRNLYYTGHLTVPGPGVPPSIISGKVVATEVIKNHKT